jgi:hypothetical protein
MKLSSTILLLQTRELLISTTFDFYQQKNLNGHLPSTSLVGVNFQPSRCIKKCDSSRKKMFIFNLKLISTSTCIIVSSIVKIKLLEAIVGCCKKEIHMYNTQVKIFFIQNKLLEPLCSLDSSPIINFKLDAR